MKRPLFAAVVLGSAAIAGILIGCGIALADEPAAPKFVYRYKAPVAYVNKGPVVDPGNPTDPTDPGHEPEPEEPEEPEAPDLVPDSFSFGHSTGYEPSYSRVENPPIISAYSPTVTLSGFDGELPATFRSDAPEAEMRINGNAVASVMVKAGDTISLSMLTPQLAPPSTSGRTESIEVRVGDIVASWLVTSRDADLSPDSFSFPAVADTPGKTRGGQARMGGWDKGYSLVASTSCTDPTATFTVSQDQVSGSWTAPMTQGTSFPMQEGWRLKFSAKTPASGVTMTCTATIGGMSRQWTLTGL